MEPLQDTPNTSGCEMEIDGRGSCLSFEIWNCGGGDGRHRFARLLGAAPWAGPGGALVEAVSGAEGRLGALGWC